MNLIIIVSMVAVFLIYRVYKAFKNAPVQFEWEDEPKVYPLPKSKKAVSWN